MRVTRPLVRIDPGWLFIVAGLTMVFAIILIPPQIQLHTMRQRLDLLRAEEAAAIDRLRAYSDFIVALDEGEEVLIRRLAAAQLNRIRADESPVLIAASANQPVTEWIESTVERPAVLTRPYPQTRLTDLVTGPHRHWALAASALCLFIGLVLGPGRMRGDPASTDDG